jgi:FixJ family two-component response regulator
MAEPFDVSIVDDSGIVRKHITGLVRAAGMNAEPFADPESFLARLAHRAPACVVMSFRLPGMSGPQLHDHLLGHGLSMPVVMLVDYDDFPAGLREMKNRDADFLPKPVESEALMQSLQAARDRIADMKSRSDQQQAVLSHWQRLTPRERQVLEHVLGGYLNKQTAFRLGIAEKTVKVHRQRVMEKMDARSVAQLVRQCERAGIQPCQTP